MAELKPPGSRRCNYFFLYDGSKVTEEGDPTREGICYFYPEETPLDKQELLCGQLAGVGRCVSELSSSPVRTLRLRRSKFAIRMKDDFFWALGCSVDIPTVSICELLDQLINLFCFYHGSVRQSYQFNSQETLAAQWAYYLSHLQSGPSELYNTFSSLRTIDSTNVDPLLLLKAALILQACQRCPLVLAGCILFKGRLVSTQMPPELTMKVMVHESESYAKAHRSNSPSTSSSTGGAVISTNVFLTRSELQYLQSAPVDKDFSSHSTPLKDARPKRTRLSRTLSDTPSTESEPSDPSSSQKLSLSPHLSESDNSVFSPALSQKTTDSPNPSNRSVSHEPEEGTLEDSFYHSFYNSRGRGSQTQSEGDGSVFEDHPHLNGDGDGETACGPMFDYRRADSGNEQAHDDKMVVGDSRFCCGSGKGHKAEMRHPPPPSCAFDSLDESRLIPMTLYMHRVNSLVLALLVEPHFMSDTASMEEVYHSSLASLNGLEAHLRSISPGPPGAPGAYIFAHFDCIQSTLTTNVSGRPGGAPEHPFVRATSLLHSHFCNTETLQEAIIRSASTAVYGTRSVAQETYFQQHGGALRNSGIPNHQDSAFSLPSKARHRLLKHGVNLL
ncbi:Hermansky-Pudlak syndrome 4 protein [Melanotaenia boesemani]|uniref:Hermansky-Pudlak syndrome 4 protein n=1 Tax=Melanotaenia boesemani TaxID=1250792 RepID=UPI001C0462C4|nr:Hermansky-Pudlak syndrome 4 protein [Melanotaenia boesemani]XP_041856451.1 Hermansky-Pudlak syndrome 4 protein [Melanotaenia boesemani]XP_041856452.1 Hermansky-Pudlak syndrome 4 protein [Melanotaenia boesemani]